MTGAQKLGAHGRSRRQRNHQRYGDRDAQCHREFAKQSSDDPAHQQQWNKNCYQRYAHRKHREPDLRRSLERRLHRVHPVLDIARDVLEHHNRIIDNESRRNRQRHQRQVVEAIAQQVHPAERSHQ